MDRCLTCIKRNLDQEHILNIIKFNVGHIVYLEQVKPVGHHYAIEIITGDLMIIHNLTTMETKRESLKGFINDFKQCVWAKLEAIAW